MQYDAKLATLDAAALPASGELNRRSLPVAFAAMVGMITGSATIIQAPLGLLVVPVTHAFHIGRGTFGLLAGASMLLSAALTPLAGRAMDKHGVRRVVLPGIAAFGLAQLLLSATPISVPLLGLLLMFQGAVSCINTPMPYAKVISFWFHSRRGIMLGTASAIGVGGGSGLAAVLVGTLLVHGTWRTAYLGTGIYVWLAGLLVIWPLLREPAKVVAATNASALPDLPGLTVREALASRSFRLVMVMVVSIIGAISMMMGHGPALLDGRGLHISTLYLACCGVGSLVGQLISGTLLDRIDSPKVGLGFALATMVGGITVLHFGFSAAVVLPAAIVQGLGQGAESGLASYYISRFCGLRNYASIFGVAMALITVSAGVFPPIAGFVFDRTGSYHDVLPLIDVLFCIPPIAILFMPRYRFKATPPTGL